jgi:hypothetical protein
MSMCGTRAFSETSPSTARKKQLREHAEGGIAIDLAAPFRPYARPDEFSRLRIRVGAEKVFEIRWDKAASFQIVHYDRVIGSRLSAVGRRLFH